MAQKKLGFGLMRLPSLDANDPGKIDMEQTKKMVDTILERGFTYFDTAWMYCAFQSERAAKEALVQRHPRDSFTLATKLHSGFIKTKEDRDRIFNEQREKTGVEFFDYYLLHDINVHSLDVYNTLDCFSWIREKKAQGLVKHIGFSFHDGAALLDRVLTEHPEFEFVQLQINYLDWDSAGVQSRACYEVRRSTAYRYLSWSRLRAARSRLYRIRSRKCSSRSRRRCRCRLGPSALRRACRTCRSCSPA